MSPAGPALAAPPPLLLLLLALSGPAAPPGVGGGCLEDVPLSQQRQVMYKGQGYDFPLGYGFWNSPQPVAEVIRILMVEKMKLKVTTHKLRSSTNILQHVVGCTDEDGSTKGSGSCNESSIKRDPPIRAWAAFEVWLSTPENQRLYQMAMPLGNVGYTNFPGMYVQSQVVDAGQRVGASMEWWESYKLGHRDNARSYFSSVSNMDAAIRGLTVTNFTENICKSGNCGPGAIRPLCDTSEENATFYLNRMALANLTCTGGWWYSPACAAQPDNCIPVVWGEALWGVSEWCLTIQKLNLPMALTWVGWFREQEVVQQLSASHNFLFYWWTPDASFIGLQPSPPTHLQFRPADLEIDQVQFLHKIGFPGIIHLDSDILDFLRRATFSNEDVVYMMVMKANGTSDFQIACDWLKRNNHSWTGWLPQPKGNSSQVDYSDGDYRWSTLQLVLAFGGGGTVIISSIVVFYLCYRRKRDRDRRVQQLRKDLDRFMWQGDDVNTELCMTSIKSLNAISMDVSANTMMQELRKSQSERAGVSVAYLLSCEFDDLVRSRTSIEDPTFYEIKDAFWQHPTLPRVGEKVFCPRTRQYGCAFVDTLGPQHRQACTHFLSWIWGYRISEVRSALNSWMALMNLDPAKTFLWMCFFVNNQFDIIVRGTTTGSDNLEEVFGNNLQRIGKMIALMDDWNTPAYLSRIWTIFEVWKAAELNVEIGVIMPEQAMETLITEIFKGKDGMRVIKDALSTVDAEHARAWSKSDEEKVKSWISRSHGGFNGVNQSVTNAMIKQIGTTVEGALRSFLQPTRERPTWMKSHTLTGSKAKQVKVAEPECLTIPGEIREALGEV